MGLCKTKLERCLFIVMINNDRNKFQPHNKKCKKFSKEMQKSTILGHSAELLVPVISPSREDSRTYC